MRRRTRKTHLACCKLMQTCVRVDAPPEMSAVRYTIDVGTALENSCCRMAACKSSCTAETASSCDVLAIGSCAWSNNRKATQRAVSRARRCSSLGGSPSYSKSSPGRASTPLCTAGGPGVPIVETRTLDTELPLMSSLMASSCSCQNIGKRPSIGGASMFGMAAWLSVIGLLLLAAEMERRTHIVTDTQHQAAEGVQHQCNVLLKVSSYATYCLSLACVGNFPGFLPTSVF